ncbi:MAG TPA: urate hydroxylase PuuD [Pyrinomonadaceae bacterium]
MKLSPELSEWLNLLARWFHVFAAILWVGSTFYFTWLDGRFQDEERAAREEGGDPEVWMVHSGGFYVVGKRKAPSLRRLHWFRWEAASTWLSGMFLLTLLYYHGGLMVDAFVRDIGAWTAGGFGVGMLVAGWVVYDLLVRSPLGRNEKAFAAVAYALVVGAAYLSTHVLSARAAFIHVGATLGTIMFLNVWMGILPAQRRMIAAVKGGGAPDPKEGARAKLRSKHNTFMVVPVVFTMISNHYNLVLGHDYNWVILSALVLLGWVAAKIIRRA